MVDSSIRRVLEIYWPRVAAEGMCGYMDPVKYNDEVIFPDKVRLNRYYLHHYSFLMDLKMIFATVLGKHLEYAGDAMMTQEEILAIDQYCQELMPKVRMDI